MTSKLFAHIDRARVEVRNRTAANDDPAYLPAFRLKLHQHHKLDVEITHLATWEDGVPPAMTAAEPVTEQWVLDRYGPGDYTARLEILARGGQWLPFVIYRFQVKAKKGTP